MGYEIMSLDIELTDETKQEILNKIGKLDKFLTHQPEENVFIRIRLSQNQQNPHWTDALVDLSLPDKVLVGSESASTPVHAVHLAVINLERQLEEYKRRTRPYI